MDERVCNELNLCPESLWMPLRTTSPLTVKTSIALSNLGHNGRLQKSRGVYNRGEEQQNDLESCKSAHSNQYFLVFLTRIHSDKHTAASET